jgi:drug/metabolite transporter (DMT)-like permease
MIEARSIGMTDSKQAWGAAVVALSAACSASLAIFLKLAFAAGATITTIIAVRFILAALLLLAVIRRRGLGIRLSRRQAWQVLAMGAVGYGGMSVLFAQGLHTLSASMAGMLLYTYPAMVTVLAVALRVERPDPWKGLALLVCLTGTYLVLGVAGAGVPVRAEGVACVLGAALIYSGYILAGNRVLRDLEPLVAAFYICGSTGAAFALYGLAAGGLTLALRPGAWLAILGITLLPTFVAIVCFLQGIRMVGASQASIVCTLEPFLTVLYSWAVLGERLQGAQMAGGLLIVGGVLGLQAAAFWRGRATEERAGA